MWTVRIKIGRLGAKRALLAGNQLLTKVRLGQMGGMGGLWLLYWFLDLGLKITSPLRGVTLLGFFQHQMWAWCHVLVTKHNETSEVVLVVVRVLRAWV